MANGKIIFYSSVTLIGALIDTDTAQEYGFIGNRDSFSGWETNSGSGEYPKENDLCTYTANSIDKPTHGICIDSHTIVGATGASTVYTPTVLDSGTYVSHETITLGGVPMTLVSSLPTLTGTYYFSVDTYRFASVDTGSGVVITFEYAVSHETVPERSATDITKV